MTPLARLAWLLAAILGIGLATSAHAQNSYVDSPPPLISRITPEVLAQVYPNAGRLQPVAGPPPAVAVYDGDAIGGYIFSTLDIVRAHGYVTTPFDVIAGVTLEGNITGAALVFNRETNVNGNDRRTELIAAFLHATTGLRYSAVRNATPGPNFVSGATISANAMRAAVGDAARTVMRAIVGMVDVTVPTLDTDRYVRRSVEDLIAAGSLVTRTITNGEVAEALAAAGASDGHLDNGLHEDPNEVYSEFTVGIASVPTIGRNVVPDAALLTRLRSNFPAGTLGLLFASDGRYNFEGSSYRNASSGNTFDRIEVVQNGRTFTFHRPDYIRVGVSSLGPYTGIMAIRPFQGFDPLQPWSAVLKINAEMADGTVKTVSFPVEYQVPAVHVLLPEPEPEPLWVSTWRDSRTNLIILGFALLTVTLIFAFQAQLSKYRRVHRWVRNGFLLFTVVWIGYVAGAQLSIVHIINYLRAPFDNVDIGFYLAEPLIVVLAVYVLISLVLIGRGVFCGWLCPFGALQELTHKVAKVLHLPEWHPSPRMQKWMWLPKYGLAAIVIGTAFLAPEMSATAQEVEPFKTAINSAFSRPWPYVTYASFLLVLSLFSERAFCRFFCPLGGVLAVLDRLHLVNLLKRRAECGSPCHLCERSCPVKAIKPSGEIVTAECFQCLDCQVEYYDDQRCPPLAKDRKKRERAAVPGRGFGQPIPALARTSEA